jgi:ribonucleoside-triphosphate reductase
MSNILRSRINFNKRTIFNYQKCSIYTIYTNKFFCTNSNVDNTKKFHLDEEFLVKYKTKIVDFGFNGLGELVYRRTYSRVKEDGTNEQWWETVRRVIEGTFNLLNRHIHQNCIKIPPGFDEQLKKDSMIMYDKIFNFKFLPPGRGLWSMGTNITEKKSIYAALNNCAFVSTSPRDKNNIDDIVKPYLFLMDCAMLGVGVGFDTKASNLGIKIYLPNKEKQLCFVIQDSREGWVESVGVLLKSYFQPNSPTPIFDYSNIRPAGLPLKTFGGISAGYKPLKDLHDNLNKLLSKNVNSEFNSRLIVDIMNYIGKTVVAGNISKIKL